MPVEINSPQYATLVVFVGAFDSEFGFTLRERKSHTLDRLQVNALEVEENFTSAGKSRGKQEPTKNKSGKEEASSSCQAKESPDLKWDELDKIMKVLSHKVRKLALENKNLSKNKLKSTTKVITYNIEGLHCK